MTSKKELEELERIAAKRALIRNIQKASPGVLVVWKDQVQKELRKREAKEQREFIERMYTQRKRPEQSKEGLDEMKASELIVRDGKTFLRYQIKNDKGEVIDTLEEEVKIEVSKGE